MFKKNQTYFGNERCITYQKNDSNGSLQSLITIIPRHGANILKLALKGQHILEGHTDFESLQGRDAYRSEILLPFPNRLAKGKYSYKENTYQFPINDLQHGHSLHGLFNNVLFDIVEEYLSEDLFLKLKCSYRANQEYYPFYFDFFLTIRIVKNRFNFSFEIENTGEETIPIGIGWHPYFRLEAGDHARIDTCTLQHVQMDNEMIPNGKFKEIKFSAEAIHHLSLDDTYLLSEFENNAFLKLIRKLPNGKLLTLNFKNENQKEAFKYLQLYHPKMTSSIAIEPMTCNVNALNNQEGLLLLEPGERRIYSMQIEAELFHA